MFRPGGGLLPGTAAPRAEANPEVPAAALPVPKGTRGARTSGRSAGFRVLLPPRLP